MNKLLQTLDTLATGSLPYAGVTTLLLMVIKLFGYANYSWLIAGSPVILIILIVGAVNFLSFYLDQDQE